LGKADGREIRFATGSGLFNAGYFIACLPPRLKSRIGESGRSRYNGEMKIITAKPLPGYRLELKFNNSESGVVDVSEFVGRGVFAVWEQLGVFERVAVTSEGAVEWPGNLDMCPDALYLRMTGKRPEDLFSHLSCKP
jgi:hypothetical protein